MGKIYFTVTGLKHYHGDNFIEPGMKVKLIKEPDNELDKEAIRVEMKGLSKIGHVANSPYTVIGDSYSAGRLYDKIGEKANGRVLYVMSKGLLCYIDKS